MNKGYKYKVVEEKENFKDSVIEKSNVTVKFTLNEIEEHEKRVNKMLEELEANYKLTDAIVKNIENNHKFVLKATESQVFKAQTLAMYVEKKSHLKKIEDKIKEINEAKKEYADELADIENQIGVAVSKKELDNDK